MDEATSFASASFYAIYQFEGPEHYGRRIRFVSQLSHQSQTRAHEISIRPRQNRYVLRQEAAGKLWDSTGPHVPLYAPVRFFDRVPEATVLLPEVRRNDLDDISRYAVNVTRLEHIEPRHEWIVEEKQWQRLVQSYLACINFADEQVGRLLREVETSAYRDNREDLGHHLTFIVSSALL